MGKGKNKKKLDDLAAVREVVDTLKSFDRDVRERIVRWAHEKLDALAPRPKGKGKTKAKGRSTTKKTAKKAAKKRPAARKTSKRTPRKKAAAKGKR